MYSLGFSFRGKREQEKVLDKKRKSLGLSDDVNLLPESDDDKFMASCVQFGDPANFGRKWQQKRKAIKSQSIFAPSALTKWGQKWEEFGQKWDQFSHKVRKDSTEESAERPKQSCPYEQEVPHKFSKIEPENEPRNEEDFSQNEASDFGSQKLESMDVDHESLTSTQSDDEQIKATFSTMKRANETWPSEPVKCSKLDANPDLWVCSREASAGMAKFFKCPLNTISEDREMDCSQLGVSKNFPLSLYFSSPRQFVDLVSYFTRWLGIILLHSMPIW